MKITAHSLLLLSVFLLPAGLMATEARTHGGYYSAERLANAWKNCEQYDWARELRQKAVDRAAVLANKSDEVLWQMVPGQDLPRCIDVTFDYNAKGAKNLPCLKCDKIINGYGRHQVYVVDFEKQPWKIVCPVCKVVFPTNDFGKFYASGLDEHGLFHPDRGDRSLLFNTEHPDPKDPLHKYGVDDGNGWIDQNGRAHKFIAYYAFCYWRYLYDGIWSLANAYIHTGEQRYAHKAAILLNRFADVYPSMDWNTYANRGWFHSDGNTKLGKIEGAIWETSTVRRLADSYDAILGGTLNDPALYEFLRKQSERYRLPAPQGTREQMLQHIDTGVIRCALQGVLSGQVRGNEGMQQLAVLMCALALNSDPETTQWLDWLFAPDGGAIPGITVNLLDHDGLSNEGAPNYSVFWGSLVSDLAARLAEYPRYTRYNVFRDLPQFNATFLAAYKLAVQGVAIPNIGDSGSAGLVSRSVLNVNVMLRGYRYTRNPEIAVALYRANKNSVAGLERDIFAADPEAVMQEIQRLGEAAGPRPEGGYLMSGTGLAILESGPGPKGTAIACNYGRTIYHAHRDRLNFDLFAFGRWLAPDHGYPEFATKVPGREEWTDNTLSHNLVVVDQVPQVPTWGGGHTRLFQQLPGFGAFSIDGRSAYPQTSEYARTMLLIDGPARGNERVTYAVDIFRVVGGQDHLYSFHGPAGEMTAANLQLVAQAKGTYAGEDVPLGTINKTVPMGHSFLYNVRRDNQPAASFSVDWKVAAGYHGLKETDGVHLRMYSLTPCNDVALADGSPPQNKAGNPKQLGYTLLHRAGKDLSSTFVTVLEPYKHTPFIQSVRRLDDGNGLQIALQIDFVSGETDYVLYNLANTATPIRLANGLSFTGTAAQVRESSGQVVRAVAVEGTALTYKQCDLRSPGAYRGKVAKMNRELGGGALLWTNVELPVDGRLNGKYIHLATDTDRDATYQIRKVTRDGALWKIDCGDITFVRGYQGPTMTLRHQTVPKDYTQGYLYDFEEGAAFSIPLAQPWTAEKPAPARP
ncbi:MAG: heparinase II/III family protein [Opitutae bacterium]|nr:heparinase II/III family protein [Opitutae bacterium]